MTSAELLTQLVNGYVEVTPDERMILMMSNGSRTELMDAAILNQLIDGGLVADRGDCRYRASSAGVQQVRSSTAPRP